MTEQRQTGGSAFLSGAGAVLRYFRIFHVYLWLVMWSEYSPNSSPQENRRIFLRKIAPLSSKKNGSLIYFDWDNKGSSGPQDGLADHVGIVEKGENGIVYTVEGNSGDSCRERQYSIGPYEIYGYATPAYSYPAPRER